MRMGSSLLGAAVSGTCKASCIATGRKKVVYPSNGAPPTQQPANTLKTGDSESTRISLPAATSPCFTTRNEPAERSRTASTSDSRSAWARITPGAASTFSTTRGVEM